jgi:hypothetical protein
MCRPILFLTIGLLTYFSAAVYAQEKTIMFQQLKSKLPSIKNPFKSKLPQPEPEPAKPKDKPEKTEPMEKKPIFTIPKIQEEPLPPIPAFTVTGIIWDSDRPQAIMNGQIINIGDTIAGVKITEITKTDIRGTFYGKSITIKPGDNHE